MITSSKGHVGFDDVTTVSMKNKGKQPASATFLLGSILEPENEGIIFLPNT
jgi:hypothetical protein